MLDHCIRGMFAPGLQSVTVLVTGEHVIRGDGGHVRVIPRRSRGANRLKHNRASTLNAHRPVIQVDGCQVDAPLQRSEPRGGVTMRSSSPRVFVAVASLSTLLGVTLLATGGDARTTNAKSSAKAPSFVPVCVQRTGGHESRGDLNILLHKACAKGQKPLKLALFPVAGAGTGPTGPQGPPGPDGPLGPAGPAGPSTAGEYAVANVFVSRGTAAPGIWATYSAAMGSPIGTTTGGQFRFTCRSADKHCKVSISAAVLSNTTGSAHVYARVLIYKQIPGGPENYCEYADGSDNNSTPATISRVPMSTIVASINTPLNMGIGGSLDCESAQVRPPAGVVNEIEVPGGPTAVRNTTSSRRSRSDSETDV